MADFDVTVKLEPVRHIELAGRLFPFTVVYRVVERLAAAAPEARATWIEVEANLAVALEMVGLAVVATRQGTVTLIHRGERYPALAERLAMLYCHPISHQGEEVR